MKVFQSRVRRARKVGSCSDATWVGAHCTRWGWGGQLHFSALQVQKETVPGDASCIMKTSLCAVISVFFWKTNKQTKHGQNSDLKPKKAQHPPHTFFFFFNLNPVQIYQITYFPPFLKKLISYAEPLCGICHLHSPEQRNKTSCREGTVLLNPS